MSVTFYDGFWTLEVSGTGELATSCYDHTGNVFHGINMSYLCIFIKFYDNIRDCRVLLALLFKGLMHPNYKNASLVVSTSETV